MRNQDSGWWTGHLKLAPPEQPIRVMNHSEMSSDFEGTSNLIFYLVVLHLSVEFHRVVYRQAYQTRDQTDWLQPRLVLFLREWLDHLHCNQFIKEEELNPKLLKPHFYLLIRVCEIHQHRQIAIEKHRRVKVDRV